VSRFDLRDISERLTQSRDTEAVVFEFLGYLQSVRSDWCASLAFYEVSQDRLVNVYVRENGRLIKRNIDLPADNLPPRLVRKFFHPSAFFNHANRRSMLATLLQSSPAYEVEPNEAPQLAPIAPLTGWQSCACLALTDREDVIALLVLASERKAAFGGSSIGDLIPVKSMAALALAQNLQPPPSRDPVPDQEREMRAVAQDFQEQMRRLQDHASRLESENHSKEEKLTALRLQMRDIEDHSSRYREELEDVKGSLSVLEINSAEATEKLSEAYLHLDDTRAKLVEMQRTVGFMRDIFQVLSQEHRRDTFTTTMLTWFCEHFGVQRCSLMIVDGARESMRIAAYRGMEPSVASGVRVRLGQGIAGWVAHHRKPLLILGRSEAEGITHTDQDAYNSDSFVSVPLVFNGRLYGVLNLSNKADGAVFNNYDLDRAILTGSILGMVLGALEQEQRAIHRAVVERNAMQQRVPA
jgi:transcriptional regulator with GAF, ATPase, and Fis domain